MEYNHTFLMIHSNRFSRLLIEIVKENLLFVIKCLIPNSFLLDNFKAICNEAFNA